jgi:hypothetical protein
VGIIRDPVNVIRTAINKSNILSQGFWLRLKRKGINQKDNIITIMNISKYVSPLYQCARANMKRTNGRNNKRGKNIIEFEFPSRIMLKAQMVMNQKLQKSIKP